MSGQITVHMKNNNENVGIILKNVLLGCGNILYSFKCYLSVGITSAFIFCSYTAYIFLVCARVLHPGISQITAFPNPPRADPLQDAA